MAQSVGVSQSVFSWDTASSLPQALATSDGALYLYGLDLVAQQQSDTWQYPLGDALGSIRQWTDDTGTVTYAAGYTPFGEELWHTGSAASAWGYTGEWQDPDVGLLYLRARWYDGKTGRFTQVDPWEGERQRPISLHPYQYASGDPINRIDPSGRIDYLTWHWAITGLYLPDFPCDYSFDFQPYERYGIYMGDPSSPEEVAYWNEAPAVVIKACDRFVARYDTLANNNLVEASKRMDLQGVYIAYLPSRTGHPSQRAQRVGDNRIEIGDEVHLIDTRIRRFGGLAAEEGMIGTLGHEYTHLVDASSQSSLRWMYCSRVGGHITLGKWEEYPHDRDQGYECIRAGEDLANAVGFYIAVGSAILPRYLAFPNEAISFIEGPFAHFLETGELE